MATSATVHDVLETVSEGVPIILDAGLAVQETLLVPGDLWLPDADFLRVGWDLIISGPDGAVVIVVENYFVLGTPTLSNGTVQLKGDLVERLAGPMAPGQLAQAGADDVSPVGQIGEAEGGVWLVRVDGTREAATAGSSVFLGDIIETAGSASVFVEFVDGTSLSLSDNARLLIDEFIYDPRSSSNSASLSLVSGLFVLISGGVAKSGDMVIETPSVTIGIRGPSVAIEAGAGDQGTNVTLLADPDGNIGVVAVSNSAGTVTLSDAGATTSITSAFLTPSPVVVLPPDKIEQAYGKALSTMKTQRSLDVRSGNDGSTTGDGAKGEVGAEERGAGGVGSF